MDGPERGMGSGGECGGLFCFAFTFTFIFTLLLELTTVGEADDSIEKRKESQGDERARRWIGECEK